LREIEEQFAILERIPYRETDLLLSVLGEHIERSFLRLGQVEKFLTGGKVLFWKGAYSWVAFCK